MAPPIRNTPTKLQYGSFCVLPSEKSWSRTSFYSSVGGSAPDVYRNPSSYLSCYWDVAEVDRDSGEVYRSWPGQQFDDVGALYSFIATKFGESTSTPGGPRHAAFVTLYDVVDDDIPVIDKIYGMNTFYSILRGRGRYKSGSPVVDAGSNGWSRLSSWLSSVRSNFQDLGSGAMSNLEAQMVWFPAGSVKMYGAPPPGFSAGTNGPSDRRAWDSTAGALVAPNATFTNQPDSGGSSLKLCYIDTGGGTYTWRSAPNAGHISDILKSGSRSAINVYYLTYGSEHAVFVKPIGIDRVGVRFFDPRLYELWAFYSKPNRSPLIKKVDVDPHRQSVTRSLSWVEMDDWAPDDRKKLTNSSTAYRIADTSFFLRNKITGKISYPSRQRVKCRLGRRDAPFSFEICYN